MKSSTSMEGGALTPSELDWCRAYAEQTGNDVLAATQGLSGAQWNFKVSGTDRWSIAEIVEHIVVVQELILGPIAERLAQAPGVSAGRDYKEVEDIVLQRFPIRDKRFPAPEFARPAGRWTPSESLDRLIANGSRLYEYAASTPDLRLRTIESGPLKAVTDGRLDQMDGYQFVLAAAAHTRRHVGQILEVKADPSFPA